MTAGLVRNLFVNYLHGRTQRVDVDDVFSELLHASIACGVPQENVFGPLLLVTFITTLPGKNKADVAWYACR